MKKVFNIILYISIGLLIIGGLLLFIFRDEILNNFRTELNSDNSFAPAAVSLTAKDTIDPEIIKDQRLASLTNYVVNFNFDIICRRPDVVNKPGTVLANTTEAGTGTATGTEIITSPLNCRLGNDLPFLVRKK